MIYVVTTTLMEIKFDVDSTIASEDQLYQIVYSITVGYKINPLSPKIDNLISAG